MTRSVKPFRRKRSGMTHHRLIMVAWVQPRIAEAERLLALYKQAHKQVHKQEQCKRG